MYNDLLLDRLAMQAAEDEAERLEEARIEELIEEIEALESLLDPEARELIENLRGHTVTDDVYEEIEQSDSLGDRLADQIASFAGSWRFILSFCGLMALWIVFNALSGPGGVDPYPFILLNLMLSTMAGLQAPVILMAQNRQGEKDRAVAQNDYQVNLKNELEIADMHRKIDDLCQAMTTQTKLVNALVEARKHELAATVRVMETRRASTLGK
jgi:uncharacterized membrane protein